MIHRGNLGAQTDRQGEAYKTVALINKKRKMGRGIERERPGSRSRARSHADTISVCVRLTPGCRTRRGGGAGTAYRGCPRGKLPGNVDGGMRTGAHASAKRPIAPMEEQYRS